MINFFAQFPELLAVMSEKADGSMRIVEDEIVKKQNKKNREVFFEKVGINTEVAVIAGLIHGNNAEIIDNTELRIIPETDGLVTMQKKIFLGVTIADCIPIFFYEKEKGIIALTHAGWRGILKNVLENTIINILNAGGNIANLHVSLGPGINSCHFEIQDDVIDEFMDYEKFIMKREGKMFINLKGIIEKKLLDLGICEMSIENNPLCTYCLDSLFSFRRDKPKITEAMIAIIGMK